MRLAYCLITCLLFLPLEALGQSGTRGGAPGAGRGGGASSGFDSRSGASRSGRSLLGEAGDDDAESCAKDQRWNSKTEACEKKCKEGMTFHAKDNKCVKEAE
jgi:hypothetical protein